MARIEKTIFISYRRADVYTALAVYENLKNQGYDVFFDYRSISSGDFEQIITSNIRARAHFVLILTPTALDRCNEPGDWLRREIEIAIDEKRNIVPLFFKGFRFGAPSTSETLTGKLRNLSRYNGLNVHEDYFDEAMHRLRTQYLNIPLNTILHPVSTEVRKVVREEQRAADKALEQIEDVIELVKQPEVNLNTPIVEADLKPVEIPKQQRGAAKKIEKLPTSHSRSKKSVGEVEARKMIKGDSIVRDILAELKKVAPNLNLRPIGLVAGGVLIISFLLWGGSKLLQILPVATPETTLTFQSNLTSSSTITSQPSETDTSLLTRTSSPSTQTFVSPTSELGIGSTMISEKDGMTLLYVPDGEFTMGSDTAYADNEKPAHVVYLDAFWIDQTEVTNKMYTLCVSAMVCPESSYINSYSRGSYYRNSIFDNYPVIYIDWKKAKTYCEWADRRLPTEAEWEKAARGENAFTYPWGNDWNQNLLNADGLVGDTTEVGNYPGGASPYGALDMAGNVSEWVQDWYSETYYAGSPTSNPLGPSTGTGRVIRSGSWTRYGFNSISNRSYSHPNFDFEDTGFRCARDATP